MIENIIERRRQTALQLTSHNPNNLESIAFFYCRHGNHEKDNFLVVMRSLISQLIQQDPEIAPLVYDKMSRTGGTTLVSRRDAQQFLEFVLTGSSATGLKTYIVVDGLDECETNEMAAIVTTLTTLAHCFNAKSRGSFRLFFTSRNETAIRKLLKQATKLAIKPTDNQQDIKTYTHHWSLKIQEKFGLFDNQRQELEKSVISRANGMFCN